MTVKAPQQFFDELDNIYEIKTFLKRKNNNFKVFAFLYNHFIVDKQNWISSLMLQERLCISSSSVAYHILSSFMVLNLLEKKAKSNRKVIFLLLNPSYWSIVKKDLERKEVNNAANGQNPPV